MKKFLFIVIAFAALFSMAACNDSETYADQRNRERDSINAFLRNEKITVINEKQFKENRLPNEDSPARGSLPLCLRAKISRI